MSFKIERDTYQTGPDPGPSAVPSALKGLRGLKDLKDLKDLKGSKADGVLPGTSGDHPIAEMVGTALTGGKENAGTKGYLAVR